MTLCAIWDHLQNFKNLKNIYEEVLLLVKLQVTSSNIILVSPFNFEHIQYNIYLNDLVVIFETKYDTTRLVVEDSTAFKTFEMLWSILQVFLEVVFHKFFLAHSWILCLKYSVLSYNTKR